MIGTEITGTAASDENFDTYMNIYLSTNENMFKKCYVDLTDTKSTVFSLSHFVAL